MIFPRVCVAYNDMIFIKEVMYKLVNNQILMYIFKLK